MLIPTPHVRRQLYLSTPHQESRILYGVFQTWEKLTAPALSALLICSVRFTESQVLCLICYFTFREEVK
jgi:hypothetical protein